MPNFGGKLFLSVSLVPAKTCAKFLFYSFIRSKYITPNRMHVFACKMPEMHPKIVFLGFRVGKFDTLMLRPPRKSILSETRHLVQKRRRYISPSVLQSLARNHQKNKNYTINFWTLYFIPLPGGPCWAACSKFLHVGWHPRRNHAYQIVSRSHRGLRSYGGPKSGFSFSFSNRSYNSVSHYRATLWKLTSLKLCVKTTR